MLHLISQVQTNNNNQIAFSAFFGPGMRKFDMRKAGITADAEREIIDFAKGLCGSDEFCLRNGKGGKIDLVYIPCLNTKEMKVDTISYQRPVDKKSIMNWMTAMHEKWLKYNKSK